MALAQISIPQSYRYVQESTIAVMDSVTASVARQTLPALLDRVEAGEEVRITRHGRVVAVMIDPKRLRSPRAAELWKAADELGARLEAARSEPLEGSLSAGDAEELVAWIREGRDSR